ncbi:MAG: hypothetical protein A2302_00195 [Candidatus Yanofskybacteria bacterium RIFOXYB2_FULL_44_18]|nr:MAG: hypothetical protein A2302_00195 [Candidatus Yanofskybacteria bacterium RIFOXYB2_FULL_44_18]
MLRRLEGEGDEVVISRAGASDLRGRIEKVDDDGCYILVDKHPTLAREERDRGGALVIFVDFSHIRGVGRLDGSLG